MLAFLGPGIYFPLQKCFHRYQMNDWIKQQTPEHFTRFVFTNSQLNALLSEDENEFELDGKRYDILRKQKDGNNTVAYCVNDSDEELLYAKASGEAGDSNRQWQVIKSISLLLYSFSFIENIIKAPGPITPKHSTCYINHYRHYQADIISPPPRF